MKIRAKTVVTLMVASLVWVSCKNDGMGPMTPLNINYPAAFVVNGQDNTVSHRLDGAGILPGATPGRIQNHNQ